MIETVRHILVVLLIATLLPSCSGDEPPYNDSAELYDIVTYLEANANGTVFTFQKQDDSPLITLFAPGKWLDSSIFKTGCRMLIGYYPANGEPYQSGNINLSVVSVINNGVLKTGDTEKIGNWDNDAIFLNSIWRSGSYINIYFRVEQSAEKRRFLLMMDEATSQDEYPQLYLVHDMLGQPENYTRRAYASFDISELWDKSDCRGVTIHVNDSNLETDTYTFTKQ